MKSDMVRTDHIVQYSEQQLRKSAPSVLYTSAYRRVFMMPKAMLLLIPAPRAEAVEAKRRREEMVAWQCRRVARRSGGGVWPSRACGFLLAALNNKRNWCRTLTNTKVTQRVQPQSATPPAAHRPDRTPFRRQPRTRRARTRLLTVRPRALHDCTDRTPRRQVRAPATPSTQTCSCVIEARLDGFGCCSAVCSPNLGGGGCGEASRRGPPPRPRHPAQASPADLWLATTCR